MDGVAHSVLAPTWDLSSLKSGVGWQRAATSHCSPGVVAANVVGEFW